MDVDPGYSNGWLCAYRSIRWERPMPHAFIRKPAPAADGVTRGAPLRSLNSSRFGVLQRKCGCDGPGSAFGECAECKAERGAPLQRHTAGRSDPATVPPIVHDVLRSPGEPLDAATRAFMEPRFGHDFSQVRVHADAEAEESALAVNALAYTIGRDVVFGARQYVPETFEGRRLIAHELTHVLQQSGNRNNSETVDSIADSLGGTELEADTLALEISNARFSPSKDGFDGETLKIRHGVSHLSASPLTIQRDKQPWPFNGYVINNSSKPVEVWSDTKGLYEIGANSTSGRFDEDVDHIKDKNGNWYKIGPNTVTVDKNGNISGYKCKVSKYGEDCPTK